MNELYDLKEKLIKELCEYSGNTKFSKEDAEVMKYLSSTVDHLCNIIEDMEGEEYSQSNGMRYSYDQYGNGTGNGTNGNSMRYPMGYGRSYARGRGSNARRDSMGRYSSAGDFEAQLTDLISDAPSEEIRRKLRQLMNDMH